FGLRIANALGPAELLFFMTFVAAVAYWASEKERPPIYFSLVWPPIIAFAYAAGYMCYEYFFNNRTEYMMNQNDGWLLFTLALVAYLALSSGKVWKPFFFTLLAALILSAIIATAVEFRNDTQVKDFVRRLGWGSMSTRSYGDTAVKTTFLAMCIIATSYAVVMVGFAKRPLWRYLSIAGTLSGLWILFLDRGRIHWVGMALAIAITLLCMPLRQRLRSVYSTGIAMVVCLLLVLMSGPAPVIKVSESWV